MTGTPAPRPQFRNQRKTVAVGQLAIEQDRPIVIDENGFLGIRQRRDVRERPYRSSLRANGERRCHLRLVFHQQHAQYANLSVTSFERHPLGEHCGKVAGHSLGDAEFVAP